MADLSRRQAHGCLFALLGGLLLGLVPRVADAGGRLECKGVVTFADAMNRAVTMSLDLDRGTAHLAGCTRYAELHRFCRGDILRVDDHRFRFGGIESPENTRLEVELYRDDAAARAGYAPPRLNVVFLGRCGPAARPRAM